MALRQSDAWKSIDATQRHYFGKGSESGRGQVDYKEYAEVGTTKEAELRSVQYGGAGRFPVKPENSNITLNDWFEEGEKTWNNATYASGYVLSHELIQDSRLRVLKSAPAMLGEAGEQTPDYVMAEFLDDAFTDNDQTADGAAAVSASHLLPNGQTTVSNKLSTDAALAEESVQDLMTLQMNVVNSSGLKTGGATAEKLVVPTNLWHVAKKLASSDKQVGSANNDPSVINGMFKVCVARKLTNTTQWFMTAKYPGEGMGLFIKFREKLTFVEDAIPMQLARAYLAHQRFMYGIEEWRKLWGSQATS